MRLVCCIDYDILDPSLNDICGENADQAER